MAATTRGTGRRRILLTARGWWLSALAVISIGIGSWARYPGLIGLGLGSLAAVLATVCGLATGRRLRVHRIVPLRPVERLSEVTMAVRIENPAGQSTRDVSGVELIGGVAHPLEGIRVAGGSSAIIELPLETTYPGELTVGPFLMRQNGFAGLARMSWTDRTTADVTVVARSLPVTLPASGAVPQEVPQPDRSEGGGTELRSLRNYVPGDDIRRVNARISARMGTLMLRQDAEPAILSLRVLIDNRSELTRDDYAEILDLATSVCAAAVRQGLPVVWSGRGMTDVQSVDLQSLDGTVVSLARLPLSGEVLPRSSTGDLTILLTGPDTDLEELTRSVTAHGDHRHLVVLCVDPDAGSGTGPAPAATVLRAATAEMCLHQLGRFGRMLVGADR